MSRRDDFSQKTIDTLCERVGGKCSNPICRKETKGPHSDPRKRVSVGEAAHITAAAKGGPRYNPDLTPEERSGIENGIWLCSNCARMIDNDEKKYPVELLKMWKYKAEYEQACIINQGDNCLKNDIVVESRKNVACRNAKEALDNLHDILQYAYKFWQENFKDRYYDVFLENELIRGDFLYKSELERINQFQEEKATLHEIVKKYSLDLGQNISQEIEKYCSYLDFTYESDNGIFYNNYWSCFFETLSMKFSSLEDSKKRIDDALYQQYLR